ncbi:MAG: hypothetical protein DRR16_02725 [Candidatus Parabeggiatoa sp. nov. 3]|nr:MAG: hypothetical protein DRR00_07300 [Gammaproteobacteria bacterium]RKZ60707.1 MAG: hypothetical protein DRQ99_21660 [Gammaproteobacteria bacterium]RKZ89344.1 MAG: hypothetical protein DRR16_02725 [Gammaproteobacteria bacterium]
MVGKRVRRFWVVLKILGARLPTLRIFPIMILKLDVILGAGINLTFIFWQPQVATWGYSHFQAKISLREILA